MATPLSPSRSASLGDRYTLALCCALAGYALMGKGFAYWGYRPLFVGEIAFVAGLFVLLRSGCLVAVFASGPSLLLAAAMGWALLRTFPYLDTYGSDALRDSVILVYGVFAFVVAALLIEDYRRIDTIISYYQKFLDIYVPVVPILFPLSFYFADYIPNVPGTSVGLVWLGAGEVATHLAGATVFILTGMRKPTPIWTACLITAVVMVGAVSRAAVLAFAVPVVLAALALGKLRPVLVVVATGTVLLAASYAIETTVSGYQEARVSTERRISVAQIVENIASIVGQGGAQTEDTTQWRANWWRTIVEKTVHGPYFWTGRGFGVNLAVEDGLARANSERPLRSPHSAHMTILARAGVPGLVLWAAFLAAWFGTLLRAMVLAYRRGHTEWAALMLFIACYVSSCIINASFDVALEAPMQGTWFWCLIGFGIGATMIYRYLLGTDESEASGASPPLPAGAREASPPA
ncbi:O-antigen ligase family protein [Bradyrhizobium quebecense]|uniref:O-antigen ligase family protein n=1 Tax=Bradyrhizobium quebecense TaxID=2748629 RepID=A0A973WRY6_9BRAD|nr:O-antigen ligase family protein [Bradyrhizobium quebecense]UGA45906.1 O-antigen ligase family protein [Bradyrhizobium quebecense]